MEKTFRATKEGTGLWSMKRRLLSIWLPHVIVEQIFKNKVALLLDLTSPYYSYSDTLVNNRKPSTATIDDLPTATQLKLATYTEFTLQIAPGNIYYVPTVVKIITLTDSVIITKYADGDCMTS